MANNYYYEQPYEEVSTTTTTTPVDDDSSESTRRRRLLIIGLIIFGVVLLIILLLLLTTRPAGTNTTNNTTTIDPNRKVVLQFQGAFITPEEIQPLIDDYQKLNPNVKIEYANKWPQGAYIDAENIYKSDLNKVLRENDSVNIPDIFMVNNSWAGDYDGSFTTPSTNI